MAEMTPVAADIGPPPDPLKGVNTFSAILGIKQRQQEIQKTAQDIQTGAYQQQAVQANANQASQRDKELQAAQQLVFKGAKSGQYTKEDGALDRQKMADDLVKVAPTYGGELSTNLLSQANEIVHNQQAHQNLSRSQQEQMGSSFGALATKKDLSPTDFVNTLNTLTDQNKDPQFKRMAMSMLTHLPAQGSPQQLQEIARRWSIAATSPESATGQSSPQVDATVNAQGDQQYVNKNPQAPGGVGPVGGAQPLGLPPQTTTTPSGQVGIAKGHGLSLPGSGGSGKGGGKGAGITVGQQPSLLKKDGSPRTAQDDAPGINAPKSMQDSYLKSVDDARSHVSTVRDADESYGTNTAVSNAIRRLAGNTKTGPGTETWHNVLGALGAPVDVQAAANYQTLGALLERQAAGMRTTLGLPGTNAGQAAAESAAGKTSYDPKAILAKNDFNQSLVEGLHQYRKGLDKVEGFTGNPSPKSVQTYRSAWANHFDPTLYEMENAKARGDQQGIESATKRIPATQAAEYKKKRAALKSLTEGKLPSE